MKLNKTKNKNIGIKEIAAHANVSTGPVDKVLKELFIYDKRRNNRTNKYAI